MVTFWAPPRGEASLPKPAAKLVEASARRKFIALREELYQDVAGGAKLHRDFLLLTLLSTIVAVFGLTADNVAAVIGAMVIAPLLGPNMALALATTLGDRKLLRQSLVRNLEGVVLALLSVLVLEDFAMAVYLPLLAVLAAGGTWVNAVVGIAIAILALAVTFLASYKWGHVVERLVSHPDSELLLLRVLGVALLVAGLAEFVHVSAAVGAFLVGLTLSGETAVRVRELLSPLRDLFAAIFFVSIGFMVDPAVMIPMLPLAVVLAVVTAATKVASGMYAAKREGVARPGQLRAGTALIVRGEFSLVIIALVGESIPVIEAIAMPYVFVLAFLGPVATLLSGRVTARPRLQRRVSRPARVRRSDPPSG